MPAFSVGKTHMNLVSLMHWWWAFEGLVWLFEKSGEYCVVLQGLCLLWYTFTATQLPTWGTTFCTNTLNFGYTPLCFNMYKVVRGIDIGMQHVVEVIGFLLFVLIKVDASLSHTSSLDWEVLWFLIQCSLYCAIASTLLSSSLLIWLHKREEL